MYMYLYECMNIYEYIYICKPFGGFFKGLPFHFFSHALIGNCMFAVFNF